MRHERREQLAQTLRLHLLGDVLDEQEREPFLERREPSQSQPHVSRRGVVRERKLELEIFGEDPTFGHVPREGWREIAGAGTRRNFVEEHLAQHVLERTMRERLLVRVVTNHLPGLIEHDDPYRQGVEQVVDQAVVLLGGQDSVERAHRDFCTLPCHRRASWHEQRLAGRCDLTHREETGATRRASGPSAREEIAERGPEIGKTKTIAEPLGDLRQHPRTREDRIGCLAETHPQREGWHAQPRARA